MKSGELEKKRTDKDPERKATIYLPVALARALKVHAAQRDRNMLDVNQKAGAVCQRIDLGFEIAEDQTTIRRETAAASSRVSLIACLGATCFWSPCLCRSCR